MKVNRVNVFSGISPMPAIETSSIVKKQINLNSKPIKKTKQFLKSVWESNIEANRFFDKLEAPVIRRQVEPDMTIDKFLSNLKRNNIHIVLQIGSPQDEQIVIGTVYDSRDAEKFSKVSHFAWFECLLNKENYETIKRLYQEAYGIGI